MKPASVDPYYNEGDLFHCNVFKGGQLQLYLQLAPASQCLEWRDLVF